MDVTRQKLERQLIEKAWVDENFRSELIASPNLVIEKFIGQALPQGIEIKALEETASTLYLIIPVNPDNLSDAMLDKISGGEWDGTPCNNDQYGQACLSKGS